MPPQALADFPAWLAPTLLVSGEHPDFHLCFLQGLNGLGDTVLQLVLNGSGTEELQRKERLERLPVTLRDGAGAALGLLPTGCAFLPNEHTPLSLS